MMKEDPPYQGTFQLYLLDRPSFIWSWMKYVCHLFVAVPVVFLIAVPAANLFYPDVSIYLFLFAVGWNLGGLATRGLPTRGARLVWLPYAAFFLLVLSDVPRYAHDKHIPWWQAMSTNVFDYPKAPGSGSNLKPLFTDALLSSLSYSLGAHLKLRQIARRRSAAGTDELKEPQP